MSLEDAEHLLQQRDLPAARAAFTAAEAAGEDADRAYGGRWLAAMLAGDFAAAWHESDALRARNAPDPHRFWDGSDLTGKRIIVRCLHGLGDSVQMFRYAPMLQSLAHSVVWEVPPPLLPLAPCFTGLDHVITWQQQPAPIWDSQIEVMELPYLFRTELPSLPLAETYCNLPVEILANARASLSARTPRIGLVWAGGQWDASRSLPFAALAPLLALPGILFISLQGGGARTEAAGLADVTTLCGPGLLPLAAAMESLDLIVTVDTLAAHLAGALGKPVWLLLQHAADWRWLAAGDRSPWYPTMRLFRQEAAGHWPPVIERVCNALRKEFA